MAAITLFANLSFAQDPGPKTRTITTEKKESKPYRILTNGKKITIQSSKDINYVIAWTASGHRFVEQTDVEAPSFYFTVPANEKFIFMMIELKMGKRYTEKIGVQ